MSISTLSHKGSVESLASHASSDTVLSVPDRLVPSIKSPLVWRNDELTPAMYILHLSQEEVNAIETAVNHFKDSNLSFTEINTTTFDLPLELAEKLSSVSEQIHNGIGLATIRGLDAARFNDKTSIIAFAGVASYVCPERATDPYANQTLSHIRDATHDVVPDFAKDIGLAGSKLPVAMEFHADRYSGDVLSLYVKNGGGERNGGDQYLASFSAIYNELLEVAPDALETLARDDWPFELKDRNQNKPYLDQGPVIFFSEGRVISQLVKAPLLGSPKIARSSSMPALTNEQLHALRVVEDTAERMKMKLDRQDGDIQFINNLAILHARSAYGFANAIGPNSRHLLRMFLRDPEKAWNKPSAYAFKFNDHFMEDRPQNMPVVDVDPWRKISGLAAHG